MTYLGEHEITLEEVSHLGVKIIGPNEINEFFGTKITMADYPLLFTEEQIENYKAQLKGDFASREVKICLALMLKEAAKCKFNLHFFAQWCETKLHWEDGKYLGFFPWYKHSNEGQIMQCEPLPEFITEPIRSGWVLTCLEPNPFYTGGESYQKKSSIKARQEVMLTAAEVAYLMLLTEKFFEPDTQMIGEFLTNSPYKGSPIIISNGKKCVLAKEVSRRINFKPTFTINKKTGRPSIINHEKVALATALISEIT